MNSANDIWKRVKTILREDLTETAISTWFDDCNAVKISDSCLYLHTPSTFKRDVIESRFSGNILSALGEIFSGKFDFVILDDESSESISAEPVDDSLHTNIDEYTFEQFVVGNSNKFAHAAALAVAGGHRNQDYNPLFIYGESGLGKTHLLHARRSKIQKEFPHYNITYVKGDDFTNELIAAIGEGKNVEFREKYRGSDMFLMDDIQFIAGRMSTQEEFFNTFNTLYELGKQIVFTSDRPPNEIHKLENRLRTRFESGLIADIQPPDDALRIAIIKNKAEQLGVILPEDVTTYIAENITSSVRQLEGAVKMIIAYRDIMNEDISVSMVIKRLKDKFNNPKEQVPITDIIIEETAKYHSMTPEEVKARKRTRNTVLARQITMYLIRKLTNLSLHDIGVIFDGQHHTTVMSSINRVEELLEKEPELANIIRDITSNINSR
jgi:chromosomal replication initiator protein